MHLRLFVKFRWRSLQQQQQKHIQHFWNKPKLKGRTLNWCVLKLLYNCRWPPSTQPWAIVQLADEAEFVCRNIIVHTLSRFDGWIQIADQKHFSLCRLIHIKQMDMKTEIMTSVCFVWQQITLIGFWNYRFFVTLTMRD